MSDIPDWAQSEVLPNGWQIAVMCGGNTIDSPMTPVSVFVFSHQWNLVQAIDVTNLIELEGAKAQLRLLALQS
jgi:hypothetical protein